MSFWRILSVPVLFEMEIAVKEWVVNWTIFSLGGKE